MSVTETAKKTRYRNWIFETLRVSMGIRKHPPTEKRIWLHIGAPKTGTTFLQAALLQGAQQLRSQSITYVGEGYWLGVDLRDKVLSHECKVNLREHWTKILARCEGETVILSSEGFFGRWEANGADNKQLAERLRDVFPKNQIEVVMCVRRFDKFYESLYNQTIKEGLSHDFEEFIRKFDPEGLRWDVRLRPYVDVFGASNVHIADFDKEIRDQTRFVENIFKVIDPRFKFKAGSAFPKNPSYSRRGIELAKIVNPVLTTDEAAIFRKFLETHFSSRHGEKFDLMTAEQRRNLQNADSAAREAIESMLWSSTGAHQR
jgi:hypothetical protein